MIPLRLSQKVANRLQQNKVKIKAFKDKKAEQTVGNIYLRSCILKACRELECKLSCLL
jgi:hypothetical protein